MKILNPKSIMGKLIISIILVITLINFVLAPNFSHAGEVGNTVVNTFLNLFRFIGDGIVMILQKIIYSTGEIFIYLDFKEGLGWLAWLGAIVVGVIIVAAAVVLTVLTCGLAGVALVAAGIAAGIGALGTAFIVGTVVFFVIDGLLPENLDLPIFYTTPQEIFSNKLSLLDINFFNPSDKDAVQITSASMVQDPAVKAEHREAYVNKWFIDGNKNGVYDGPKLDSNGNITERIIPRSGASVLREQISSWYNTLRTLAVIGLLTILVYIGIRILMSSVAAEKAKYKNMMGYWLTAMCLLFVLHYIMAFSVAIVEKLASGVGSKMEPVIVTIPNNQKDRDIIKKLKEAEEGGMSALEYYGLPQDEIIVESGGPDNKGVVFWPTNHMGQARINSQLVGHTDTATLYKKASYTIIYCVLVFFTCFYLVQYLKRLVYLAFLTLIAPLITLTYPIDKIGDGKAQAFDYWLKEYLCNLMLQPFHLILYLILIGSAMEFATTNPIYVCVVLGFMMPAEKMLRKMFRVDADTNKKMSGVAAGALAMAGLQAVGKLGRGNRQQSQQNSGGRDGGSGEQRTPPPRTAGDNSGFDALGARKWRQRK